MFWLFGLGILMSISPIVAHAYGGGRDDEVGRRFRQGLWLSQMLAVPLVGALLCVEPVLRWFGTDPRAIPHASGYVHAMCFGMPAMLAFLAHRYTSEGIGWTRPVMYTAIVGLAVNFTGNCCSRAAASAFRRTARPAAASRRRSPTGRCS